MGSCEHQSYPDGREIYITDEWKIRMIVEWAELEGELLQQQQYKAIRYANSLREQAEEIGLGEEQIETMLTQSYLIVSRDIQWNVWNSVGHNILLSWESIIVTAWHIITWSSNPESKYYSNEVIQIIWMDWSTHSINLSYLDQELDIGFIKLEAWDLPAYIPWDLWEDTNQEAYIFSLNSNEVRLLTDNQELGYWETMMSSMYDETAFHTLTAHNTWPWDSWWLMFNDSLNPLWIVSQWDGLTWSFTRLVNMYWIEQAYTRFKNLEENECMIEDDSNN